MQPSGTLLWRYRYRCCGVERKLSLLNYFLRSVSLRPARKRDEAEGELDDGIDPVEEKRQRRVTSWPPWSWFTVSAVTRPRP